MPLTCLLLSRRKPPDVLRLCIHTGAAHTDRWVRRSAADGLCVCSMACPAHRGCPHGSLGAQICRRWPLHMLDGVSCTPGLFTRIAGAQICSRRPLRMIDGVSCTPGLLTRRRVGRQWMVRRQVGRQLMIIAKHSTCPLYPDHHFKLTSRAYSGAEKIPTRPNT